MGFSSPRICSWIERYRILWRLFAKDWFEPLFVVDALIQSWMFFWGNGTQLGYFRQLPLDQQEQVLQLVRDYHNDASTLASFYYSVEVVKKSAQVVRRKETYLLALRDIWRQLLCQSPFPLEARLITDIQHLLAPLHPYDPPVPTTIVKQLMELAHYDTRTHFYQRLESSGRYPPDSCTFTTPSVIRHHQREPVPVNCLMIHAPNIRMDLETATTLLQEWMEAEPLDYYRIIMRDDNDLVGRTCLIYYDTEDRKGKYQIKEQGGKGSVHDLSTITRPSRAWDDGLDTLQSLATS